MKFKNGKELYLVGTAHVSAESGELVEYIITETEPDTIAVELDEKRLEAITKENRWLDIDIIKIIREKQLKKWKREWKDDLIKSFNPNLKDLFTDVSEMQ